MAQTQSAPRQHRGTRHRKGPQASDVQLGLWVTGLLVLFFGIAGFYGTAEDIDATPSDETVPAIAVLVGGSIVLLAAAVTLVFLWRDVARRARS